MLRSAGRYESPRALDCGTGAAAVRDKGSAGGNLRSMWSHDKNASPINWILLRHEPDTDSTPGISRPKKCYLLECLPLEIREMILRYCLPRTIPYKRGTAWCRGNMSILRANKQLYEEGTNVLYHENTFSLDVVYDCSFFAMTWLTPTQDPARVLHVRRQRAFPECISKRNIPKIRRLEITIRHVDSYTGMTKYGYGGGGLTDGLRTQVMFLCQVFRRLPVIDVLEISYQCQDVRQKADTQSVLDPFYSLHNVREVRTSGHILEETSIQLRTRLPEARKRSVEKRNDEEESMQEIAAPLPSIDVSQKTSLASYRGYDGREI